MSRKKRKVEVLPRVGTVDGLGRNSTGEILVTVKMTYNNFDFLQLKLGGDIWIIPRRTGVGLSTQGD